jgi:hypothetical protein
LHNSKPRITVSNYTGDKDGNGGEKIGNKTGIFCKESIRAISKKLDYSSDTVRKAIKNHGVPVYK